MDELYTNLVKMGPGWTWLFVTSSAMASIYFLVFNKKYAKIRNDAHTEAITLKEATINDLKIRLAESETEKTHYREKVHLITQTTQRLTLELAECKARPNVDSLVVVVREFRNEVLQGKQEQTAVNTEVLTALRQLNEDLKGKVSSHSI